MEDLAKYILLVLLALPFAALVTDALGTTQGLMIKVASGVTVRRLWLWWSGEALVVPGLPLSSTARPRRREVEELLEPDG